MIESTALLVDKILPYQPIRQWVLSVPYPLRLLFAKQPIVLGKVLGIVYRAIATYLIKKAGYTHKTARTGAVTFIQRFGSALYLNVHFHMLFLDGVLQTEPPTFPEIKRKELLGEIAGFSLHAGVVAKAKQRNKLERLCGYISRPAIAMHRLSLTEEGNICYELKTPYRNGTTHFIFEPLDFISKLASLVPLPRVHLIRFHGIFAPNSKLRPYIVPKNNQISKEVKVKVKVKGNKHARMAWSERLKRTFKMDIAICERCGGNAKVIACIVHPQIINQILIHLESHPIHQIKLPTKRAPPKIAIN